MRNSTFTLAICVALIATCANSADSISEISAVSCVPPAGVVRFALLSADDKAINFEWSGTSYRRIGSETTGPQLIRKFADGSIYKWNYWGGDVEGISREVAGTGELLSTPYAWSRDKILLTAGLISNASDWGAPRKMTVLRRADRHVQSIVEMQKPIYSAAWSPGSDAIVVLTVSESYRRKTAREKFSSAIGHPIPYSDITLSIVGMDGKVVCSITPAKNVDYGTGYVRWDAR